MTFDPPSLPVRPASFRPLRFSPLTPKACAERLDGHLHPIANADGEQPSVAVEHAPVHGAMPPAEASPDDVTMIDHAANAHLLADCPAVAVITPQPITLGPDVAAAYHGPRWQIVVADAHAAFTQLVQYFRPAFDDSIPDAGIDPTASIDPTAQIHPTATIGAGAVIGPRCHIFPGVTIAGGCVLGADCTLHPSVTLYPYSQLGDRVTLHAGVVIGANGFGYRTVNGRHQATAQLGYVVIDSDVEVGAGATIDRGTYGATRIGEGTKIDNQVMIAHNCQIGRHNLLCSQVGIAGSCRTGDYVVLAGQVGLKDHITLGDRVIVGAQAGVMEDLTGGQVYLGSPATTQRDQMQIMAVQRRLPEMRRELRRLDRAVAELSEAIRVAEAETPSRREAA